MALASKTAGWLLIAISSISVAAAPLFGGVKLQIREGRPIVDGNYVNGHGPYLFLIDTGTNVNLIETRLAKSMGMSAAFQVYFASSVGKALLQGCDGNEVQIDSVKANRQEFLFSELMSSTIFCPMFRACWDSGFSRDSITCSTSMQNASNSGSRTGTERVLASPCRTGGQLSPPASATSFWIPARPGWSCSAVDPDRRDQGYMRTFAGSRRIGVVSSKLVIEGRKIWRGDAVAIPSPDGASGVAGLMLPQFYVQDHLRL